jgi:prevent-host-death family protein
MLKPKNTWQLQEAKNRLSEVVRAAQDRGPQTITVRGKDAVVVMSAEEYERVACGGTPSANVAGGSYGSWVRSHEDWVGLEIDLDRNYGVLRHLDFGDE